MKLVVEIDETSDAPGVVTQCIIRPSSDDERLGQSLNNFSQANQVARFTEVAQEIKKAVNAYYSKGCYPRIAKSNCMEENVEAVTGGFVISSIEPLNQRTQHDHSSDSE